MKVTSSSKEYEKLARRIYEDIVAKQGIENITVLHDAQVTGKSGVAHQIDVYWEYAYAGVKHKVLIECKHYSHNVSLLHVRNMHALTTDIPNSTGIILTTIGFQSGAEQYADFYEISLRVLRLPKSEDWDGAIQIINIDMEFLKNAYIEIKPEFDGNDLATREAAEKDPTLMAINLNSILIEEEDQDPSTIVQWLDRNTPRAVSEFDVELEHTIIPQDTYVVVNAGQRLKVSRVKVKYVVSCLKQNLHIDHMSLIEAVLENVGSHSIEHMLPKT